METASAFVAHNVKHIREARGFKQADLARDLGWSKSTLSKLENGNRRATVDDLMQLAVALHVAPAWLLVPWEEDGPRLAVELHDGDLVVHADPVEAQLWAVGERPLVPFDDPRDYFYTVPIPQRKRRDSILKRWQEAGLVSFPDAETVVFHTDGGGIARRVPKEG